MHNELRETDIKWIAEGYWLEQFRWRFHPRVKIPWLIALITCVAGVAIAVANTVDSANDVMVASGPSAVAGVAVALVLVGVGFFLKGIVTTQAEKEQFIAHIIDEWERGTRQIPDAKAVAEFLKHREVNQ